MRLIEMIKTKLTIFLISIPLLIILIFTQMRTIYKGESFVNPVLASTGNLISDKGEYQGRAGFFSFFPFRSEYNTYLDNKTNERPCTFDFQCNTGNCSQYGYCSPLYKRILPSTWGNDEII